VGGESCLVGSNPTLSVEPQGRTGLRYPIAEMIYEIASAYYGWSFGLDPVPDPSGANTCE
jgi:hypothetical protein